MKFSNPIFWGIVGSLAIMVLFSALMSNESCFEIPVSSERCTTKWDRLFAANPNEIGDTLAGLAGSLALLWIIVTVWLQSRELSEQRKELKNHREEFEKMNTSMREQRFEVSYFEMLAALGRIVEGLHIPPRGEGPIVGRSVFSQLNGDLGWRLQEAAKGRPLTKELVESSYDEFWEKNRPYLSHYFRYLFNYFRLLDESPDARPFHGKLLRSQLAADELTLLFYNCIGSSGRKFEEYAIKFALFDNMDEHDLIDVKHVHFIDRRAFGPDKRGLLKK
tara:strand:- start:1434 stop:2264 length:831 start_codon:yes stop_codon:yes gene_type:complete